MDKLLSARDVAARLNISVCSVYRLAHQPEGLKAYHIGRAMRFRPEEVEDYLERQTVEPVEKAEAFPGMRRFAYKPGMKVVSI